MVTKLNNNHGINNTSFIITLINVMDSYLTSTLSLNVNEDGLMAPRPTLPRLSALILVIRYVHEP